jgi:hypothetical protein
MVSDLLYLNILLWISAGARVTLLIMQMASASEPRKVIVEQELIEYARV